jgi:hypothetical protein
MLGHIIHEFPKNRALKLQVLRFLRHTREKFMVRINTTNTDWWQWIARMQGRLFGFLANLANLQEVLRELGWGEAIQPAFTNFLSGAQIHLWMNPQYVETSRGG